MSPKKKPKKQRAWRIRVENNNSPNRYAYRVRACDDYEKARRSALDMARAAKEPVLMESRTHTIRVHADGGVETLRAFSPEVV